MRYDHYAGWSFDTRTQHMSSTPENDFITDSIDRIVMSFSQTALFGIKESERRKFDYSSILLRDFSRKLVCQVMWTHVMGIEKDLRTMLHDGEGSIKLYVVRDGTKTRQKLEEILLSYRSNKQARGLLRGLRVVFVPSDFDADREEMKRWLYGYMEKRFCKDILFGIVFGHLTSSDFGSFANHGGPFGLKYLVLDEITTNGLTHMPTFKERIGYKTTSPIRESLIMLSALGLIRNVPLSNMYFSTIKGRLLLDLTRRLLFETLCYKGWSGEIEIVLGHLGINIAPFLEVGQISDKKTASSDLCSRVLHAAHYCKVQFGRDLLAGIDFTKPQFFSEYKLPDESNLIWITPGVDKDFFSEPESLFNI